MENNNSISTQTHHIREITEITPAETYCGQVGSDFTDYQANVRRRFKELVGWRDADVTALKWQSLWTYETELGTIEKLLYTSELGVTVPAYLCLPRNHPAPHPVIICLQGHSTGMHRSINVEASDERTPLSAPKPGQDTALQCLRHGFAALCVEQRAFGERRNPELPHMLNGVYPNCVKGSIRAFGLGRTLLGERVFDIAGALEIIRKHPQLDATRVGTLGNSTGGTVSLCAAALYPEQIHFTLPSCCFYSTKFTFERAARCMCAYIPNILKYLEIEDIGGLVAPRPMTILAGTQDGLSYPYVCASFERLQSIYAAAGKPDNCKLVSVEGGGHEFFDKEGWPIFIDLLKQNNL